MSMTRPAGEKKPNTKPAREPMKFTVTILLMTHQQKIQMYRNLLNTVLRRQQQEASHAAD